MKIYSTPTQRDANHAHTGAIDETAGADRRIDRGSYGTCLDCGGDIDHERLLAQPAALRCLECQRMHERTHGHAPMPKL
jgi:RNA polymerase-binding transcription factor DksA